MFNRNNAFNFPHSSNPRNEFHDMLLAAVANQELCGENSAAAAAKASKKDRHSKIDTAQGPRDRRVRLSIGVARKFFDLQENLGFDKPSKTLDWLLTKSETAIQDLEVMKERDAAAAGGGSSECEVDSGENGADLKHNSVKAAAKESRAKARARARERTREKMCIKKLNETRNSINTASDFNPIQFRNNQLDFRKIASSSSNINLGFHCHPTAYEVAAANSQDLIQESIVIKRKVKNPMIFQQNLIISSSNYGVPAPYNVAAAENWDNICAILDQHKFINSTSNN